MSEQHPNRDSLSAYLEEALSIDATQWIDHHLEGCTKCQDKLDEERRFLRKLDGLHKIDVPSDFTEAVMARVAQFPAHQPRVAVPWRRVFFGAAGLAAVLFVLLALAGWIIMSGAPLDSPEASGAASRSVTTIAEFAKVVYLYGRKAFDWSLAVLQTGGTILFGLFDFVRRSGLAVQLTVLLITVALNYFLTRLVLNYQRRH